MDTTTTFGNLLRQARERRQLTLSQVAERTKVAPASLALLEEGKLDELPPEVFVRGFIRSYARTVGISDDEPIGLFDEAVAARRRQEEALAAIPTSPPPDEDTAAGEAEEQAGVPRRGFGLAVFVIIVLVIATITLSLFLRQPRQAGEDLSLNGIPRAIENGSRLQTPDSGGRAV